MRLLPFVSLGPGMIILLLIAIVASFYCTFHPQLNGIGFIAYNPARLLVIPEDCGIADSYQHSPDVWMLSEDKAYHDGKKEAKHNLCVYQPNSTRLDVV